MHFPHFLTSLAGKMVALPIRRRFAAFEAATFDPVPVQESLRQRILHKHARTQFGRDHHFAAIQSLADFRRNLPIAPYEYFEPYLKKVREGDFGALLADTRIHMFALTSGTTAARKYIPVTDQYLADYRRGWNIWGLRAYLDHLAVKLRPIVQLSGDWNEFESECGIPYRLDREDAKPPHSLAVLYAAQHRAGQRCFGQILSGPSTEFGAPRRHDHSGQSQHARQSGPRR